MHTTPDRNAEPTTHHGQGGHLSGSDSDYFELAIVRVGRALIDENGPRGIEDSPPAISRAMSRDSQVPYGTARARFAPAPIFGVQSIPRRTFAIRRQPCSPSRRPLTSLPTCPSRRCCSSPPTASPYQSREQGTTPGKWRRCSGRGERQPRGMSSVLAPTAFSAAASSSWQSGRIWRAPV